MLQASVKHLKKVLKALLSTSTKVIAPSLLMAHSENEIKVAIRTVVQNLGYI